MFGYYVGRLRLLACGSRNEPLGGVNVLSGRNGPNLQTQEATPHLVNPWVVTRKSVIPLREDVHQSDTAGQIILRGPRARKRGYAPIFPEWSPAPAAGTKPLCGLLTSLGELPVEKTPLLRVSPLLQAPPLGATRPPWPLSVLKNGAES